MVKARHKKQLSPSIDKRITSYTIAGLAGLSVFAPSPAEAAVVYTSAKQIGEGQHSDPAIARIDLNHDGVIDFDIVGGFYSAPGSQFLYKTALVYAHAVPGNQIAVVSTFAGIGIAEALNLGQEIGPQLKFSSALQHTFRLAEFGSIGFGPQSATGQFYNKRNKFVALKLAVSGKIYYGWARVSVQSVGNKLSFELVDYAYQSNANLPILAGQGIPKPTTASSAPAALGLLAYGSDALPAWRRPATGN